MSYQFYRVQLNRSANTLLHFVLGAQMTNLCSFPFVIAVYYSLSLYALVWSVFFVSAHYIFMCKCLSLSLREQVNVNLHYLSLSLMNSPCLPKSLECYTSQSVNTSSVVNLIALCNLIASLPASFSSLVSACLSFCHFLKTAHFNISSVPWWQ